MFPVSYYKKLDVTYRKALLKLERQLAPYKKWQHYQHLDRQPSNIGYRLILEFASQYLTPKEVWKKIWIVGGDLSIFGSTTYHLSFPISSKMIFTDKYKFLRKLLDLQFFRSEENINQLVYHIEELCYPHNLLEICLHSYELFAVTHLPPKVITRNFEMRKLYERIKLVEDNEEEWINTMIEADDNEFVKHNIEYKLSQDLTNKPLWHLYIKYLKQYDVQELLHIYSKYCRFFIGDVEMKEEYRKAAEMYGKATVPWKNAYEFEIYDENLIVIEYVPRIPRTNSYDYYPKSPPPSHYFNYQNVGSQKFPFRSCLMDYIVKNAKANVLQALNFSCKYFFYKYRTPFKNQKMSVDELQFFIGNVIDLTLKKVTIIDADNKTLYLEDIMALTPKLQYLSVSGVCLCSSNTAQKLCQISFKNKIMCIVLRGSQHGLLDANALGEFINKNASPLSIIVVYFDGNGDVFEADVKSIINNYWKTKPIPRFSIYHFDVYPPQECSVDF
uniref:Uncharacterized protein n=1 Tax=Panagrolaimus sp. ES5 TaxID=591445 RepID=A0AC34FD05_9BILA